MLFHETSEVLRRICRPRSIANLILFAISVGAEEKSVWQNAIVLDDAFPFRTNYSPPNNFIHGGFKEFLES